MSPIKSEQPTTGSPPVYSVTAGGYRGLPLTMALGDYVTTSSPLLIYDPPPLLERHFAGGEIRGYPFSYHTEGHYQDDEAVRQTIRLAELFFATHLPELLAKYEGQFVAILNNRVIDNDPNLDPLMERVYRRFGYRPILMRRVQRKAARPSRPPSPRRARIRRDAV